MKLDNKVAVITGGASGLGLATVEEFEAGGAKVAIFDFNEEAGNSVVERLGEAVSFFKVDVTHEESLQEAIDSVVKSLGAIHICCNYAGTANAIKTLSKKGPFPLDGFKRIIDINLIGTFNALRLCAEKMANNEPVTEDGERGVIINTASVAAYDGQVGQAAYSASKGGVVGMTLPIARDLASYGIRVNTIVPGIIHTPLMAGVPEPMYNSLVDQVQFPKRLGKPAEIALLARQMVENGYINGECVRVDGAIRMKPR